MAVSITRRILIGLAITTIAGGLCEYGWLYLKARSTATALRERTLIDQAKDIASYLVIDRNGKPDLRLPARLSEAYNNSESAYHYTIRDANGALIFTSGPSVAPLPVFNNRRQTVYDYDPDGRGPLHAFGAAVQTTAGGQTFVTQVEQVTRESEFLGSSVEEEFFTDGGWLQFPLLGVLLAVSVFIVRRSLRPLNDISRTAKLIDPSKAGVRLPTEDVPVEIQSLVAAINLALDRLDQGLIRQREFNANAAHQLRTPLAVLTANIDAMVDRPTAAKLRHDVDMMSRIVSQLLVVARLETDLIITPHAIELNGVATQVATNLAPLAVSCGMHLEMEPSQHNVLVCGSHTAVSMALSNVVENAIYHTPRGTRITIRVTEAPGVEVIDTGPGIAPEMRERIFERFWKGDRQGKGAGLGLAIVRRILTSLGGSVSVAASDTGGAVFMLVFAPADAPVLTEQKFIAAE